MTHKILVIGATGMLGEPVARQLKATGFDVRVLTRSAEKARARFGEDYEIFTGDVEDPAALETALDGCQGVHISLHGLLDPDLERRGAEMVTRAIKNIAAVKNTATSKPSIERITYLSGASVCEENCWFAGTKARFQAENILRESGIPFTIFRAHYFMETLPNFIRGQRALHIGRQPHPYHWVAAADYARMVTKAYTTPAAANKTLYVCGPQALTMRQALEIYRQIAHPETRLTDMPMWVAALIARLGKRKELQDALPFFEYCEKVKIILSGSPIEANALLGAPGTTLEDWSRQQAKGITP